MDIKKLIRKYLETGRMMQVATAVDNQPWCCTVYFVADEKFNLYWISTPDRRHSKEIENNTKVAAAIAIKHVPGKDVIGLQVEGDAELVKDTQEIKSTMRIYTDRYNRDEEWYKDFVAGKSGYKLYRIKPRLIVLFDEETFPDNTRKEYKV